MTKSATQTTPEGGPQTSNGLLQRMFSALARKGLSKSHNLVENGESVTTIPARGRDPYGVRGPGSTVSGQMPRQQPRATGQSSFQTHQITIKPGQRAKDGKRSKIPLEKQVVMRGDL